MRCKQYHSRLPYLVFGVNITILVQTIYFNWFKMYYVCWPFIVICVNVIILVKSIVIGISFMILVNLLL